MDTNTEVFDLARAATADRARVGGKAGVLGELAAAGLPVLPGLVVTAEALKHDGWECSLEIAAGSLGATRLAVRSSAAAEDLPDASYAGLYETYLNVPIDGLGEAVRRCFAAATAELVSAAAGTVTAWPPGWLFWYRQWWTRWRQGWPSPPIPSAATPIRP
jgi:rifampicin phosphotransferase